MVQHLGKPTMPDAELAREVRNRVEKRFVELLDYLRTLVRAESPTSDPAAVERVLKTLAGSLEELGFQARRIPGKTSAGLLLAYPRGPRRGHPAQLLLGHADTVWPVGTLETMPLREEEGCLWGPGVFDMKGGLAQMIWALRILKELGLEPPVTPVVLVTSDEELRGDDSRRWIRLLARRVVRTWVLEPAGPNGAVKTARKAIGDYRIVVRGRAAHAGVEPEKGINAVTELAHILLALDALNDWERGVSVNAGVIRGGTRPNVVPAEAEALLDVRAWRQADFDEVDRKIRELRPRRAGAEILVEGGLERPAMERTPGNRALWELARRTGLLLGLKLQETATGGGSDGNFTSLFTPTLDGLGPCGGGAHAMTEHIEIASLLDRTALLCLLLLAPPEVGEEA
ncbi:MAG: M20 family metallopeptidase [Acidobacteriota bacterium]